ncbi:hypothetical protein V7S43_016161 [Phytophthora oleae]|uniref:Uncharacterized protein n=1 Tax=Phytophthora oleae TaxID=2107226 RepID=A0ABD3EWF7_9STRA
MAESSAMASSLALQPARSMLGPNTAATPPGDEAGQLQAQHMNSDGVQLVRRNHQVSVQEDILVHHQNDFMMRSIGDALRR